MVDKNTWNPLEVLRLLIRTIDVCHVFLFSLRRSSISTVCRRLIASSQLLLLSSLTMGMMYIRDFGDSCHDNWSVSRPGLTALQTVGSIKADTSSDERTQFRQTTSLPI